MSCPALIGIGVRVLPDEGVSDLEIKGVGIGKLPAGCVWVLGLAVCANGQRQTAASSSRGVP